MKRGICIVERSRNRRCERVDHIFESKALDSQLMSWILFGGDSNCRQSIGLSCNTFAKGGTFVSPTCSTRYQGGNQRPLAALFFGPGCAVIIAEHLAQFALQGCHTDVCYPEDRTCGVFYRYHPSSPCTSVPYFLGSGSIVATARTDVFQPRKVTSSRHTV